MAKAVNKSNGVANAKDEATLLQELFIEELRDIYWAEKHLMKAMPRLIKASTAPSLAHALEQHLLQTMEQITRLELVFDMLEIKPRAKKCEAMEGLVVESQNILADMPKGSSALDAGIIISAQKIEHYEIASYGSLVQLAKTMNRNEIADLLQLTLNEEKETDELLTELALSGININAEHEEGQ
jgi:ferritin-like metal-binding protein YciE